DPTAVPQTEPTNTPQPAATSTPTQAAPDSTSAPVPEDTVTNTVEVSNQGSLGSHLVDSDGMTLYLFTNDERNVSNCSGGCADTWPPLLVDDLALAGEGLDGKLLKIIDRGDGIGQVTYNGKPLYYFANDRTPADTLGQNQGDAWFVVSPDGGPIRTTATVNTTKNSRLGTILTDAGGNSLYLFTNDEQNVTTCGGGCALAWPPLLTIDDPAAGAGLDEDRIGVISRANGAKQVTYNGWPLYYFAGDEKPGDTKGQDRGGVWFVVTTYGGPVYTNALVNAALNGDLGTILTDGAGRSLYLFTRDELGVSNCSGGCALAWPPLITVGDPVPGGGVDEGRMGTTVRSDGSNQVTYNGWPLYYYASDEKPGDTLGQDRAGVWFVITTDGGAIYTNAPVNAALNSDLGTILVDRAGRSLYLFTRDELGVSNCAGGCALTWPPLITVGDPVPGDGVDDGRIGTTVRSDGSNQVTYNGWPLYYYASDEKPGDAMGQGLGSVWFVITADGGPVHATAKVNATENGELGAILTDASGRSLYVFADDIRNVSTCVGSCALAWPPLITVNDPAPGEGVSAARIGTTLRAEGSKQVTFDGDPLYYYAADEKPGDSLGQDRGNVWYVINNSQPVMIVLGEQNNSGQTGTAVLSGRGSFTNVSLDLSVGSLETEAVHIHEGQCAPGDLGGVAHALTSFDGGSGASVTNAPIDLVSLMTGGFAVNTHKAGETSIYTSCGNIPAVADSLTIALREMNDSGQTGFATLTARGEQTEVVVSATFGISALAHIHEGSCQTLGDVAYGLSDTSGTVSSTTVDATLDLLTSGEFAINLHSAADASVHSSCGDFGEAAAIPKLAASRDDTLYESLGGQRNNGAGQWVFTGKTNDGQIRRGLIGFDIAGKIPAGATITGVTLTMNMSRTAAGDAEVGLHLLLAEWQEGAADALANEGSGAEADQGDVTWTHRVFNSLDWDTPGGEFSSEASASVTVGDVGSYTWASTSQLVADVKNWLDNPAANFGWLLLGDESKSQTAKRFDSKENQSAENRPVLVVEHD
ncbi:MAG: hypothetical protein BZY87_00005, partial [SAR202 cluster bacterium Io17-Chloro-G6]